MLEVVTVHVFQWTTQILPKGIEYVFWNLLPELWAEENFVTLPTLQSTRYVWWRIADLIEFISLKQNNTVLSVQHNYTYILSKTLHVSDDVFIIRLNNSLMMSHVIWNT